MATQDLPAPTAPTTPFREEGPDDPFDREMASHLDDGVFPSYEGLPEDYKQWRFENTKSILRAIYTADPTAWTSLKKNQKKIIVLLLDKLAVSNENDAIFEVLNSVLELDDATTKRLAMQLKSVSLQSVVSAIEILRRRHEVAEKLRALMNDHYLDTLETPDLQGIIEANTWLFGSAYETLGARTLTIVHDKKIYGQGLATAFKARFEARGGRVPLVETIAGKGAISSVETSSRSRRCQSPPADGGRTTRSALSCARISAGSRHRKSSLGRKVSRRSATADGSNRNARAAPFPIPTAMRLARPVRM